MTDTEFKNLAEAVNEMAESARSVKGDAFVSVAGGLFEMCQALYVLGVAQSRAAEGGVDLSQEVRAIFAAMSQVSTRLLVTLPEGDRDQASSLASNLAKRHRDAHAAPR